MADPVGTRDEWIDSLNHVAETYGLTVRDSFEWRHEARRYFTQKRIRAGLNVDIERYRYAKRSREIVEEHEDLEDGLKAMFAYQHAFKWPATRRWGRYFS